jgi:oligopeptide transport system substrate-binding protein
VRKNTLFTQKNFNFLQNLLLCFMILKNKLFVFVAFCLLFACNSKKEDYLQGKKVFRYNQINPITSLDPAFAKTQNNIWACDHLYNCLLQLDEKMNVQPCIAKNYSVSLDALTLTFNLRNDVFFHDDPCFPNGKGRVVKAQDVVYSLNRIIDKKINSPGSWIFKGRVAENQPFSAPNDSTFTLQLATPFRPMLVILTMQYCSIVPHEAVEQYGSDFRKHPVGSGAFRFKRWLENEALIVLKNDNYFEKDAQGTRLPYLDGVRVSFITDRKTTYLEMMNGKLDYMMGIESSITNELLTPEGALQPAHAEKIQLFRAPYLNTEYLGILMDEKMQSIAPLKLKKIRQALNFAIDRPQMLLTLRNNVGKPATSGMTPHGLPTFNENTKGYTYDPTKAARLLAEAGFSDGKGLPKITILTNKDYLDLCTFITHQWGELGIQASIDVMESATLRERMAKNTAPLFRASWLADYPDAESYLTVFYSKNPSPPNYTRFNNAKFDELYEKSLAATDPKQIATLYDDMEKILIEEAPVVFLFYDESSAFARTNIRGIQNNAMGLLMLKRVRKG